MLSSLSLTESNCKIKQQLVNYENNFLYINTTLSVFCFTEVLKHYYQFNRELPQIIVVYRNAVGMLDRQYHSRVPKEKVLVINNAYMTSLSDQMRQDFYVIKVISLIKT